MGYWLAVAVPPSLYFVSLLAPVAGPILMGQRDGYEGHEAYRAAYEATFDLNSQEEGWDAVRLSLAVAWFANPVLWVAFGTLVFGFRRAAVVVAGLACLMCMTVLPHWGLMVMKYPAYWLWWSSAASAVLVALFFQRRRPLPDADDYRPMSAVLTPDP